MISKNLYRHFWVWTWAVFFGQLAFAAEPAIRIDGKTYSLDDLAKEKPGLFFPIEQKKFELVQDLAQKKYLEHYFKTDKARQEYLDAKSQVSAQEIKETLAKFKDHPSLKDKSEAERSKAVAEYLKQSKMQDALSQILREGAQKKQWQVLLPEPQEPVFKLSVDAHDAVRYGPNGQEQSSGCKGDDCPITIVEYSDFECPFCARAQAPSQQVLQEYKGKIRWIVRDFPLDMHPRSRPASIAAHCAKDQGKYWEMYTELFKSQRQMSDSDLQAMAGRIGLNTKDFASCMNQPAAVLGSINSNQQSGETLGVTGTPTYFVNGRRVSGALPFDAFKQVIDSMMTLR